MKHLIRKSLSMLLVLATLLTSIPFAAFAEEVIVTEEPVILTTEEAAVELLPEPIIEPVVELTLEPITESTFEPTIEPTEKPTIEAIVETSPVPTQEITVDPTIETTETPEPILSEEPTVEPTLTPAIDSTAEPIPETTIEPMEDPTFEPTVEPTIEPTSEPTIAPTPEPTVTPTPEPEDILEIDCAEQVVGGKTIKLAALLNGEKIENSELVWKLEAENKKAASLKKGSLVTTKIKTAEDIYLTVSLKNNPDVNAVLCIAVLPVATKVSIAAPQKFIDIDSEGSLQLEAICTPEDALQEVTWTSSNKKIATVDEDGFVTAVKTGSVVITAKANDGSNKSAKITLNIVSAMQDIEIVGADEMAAGKSITLKTVVYPETATNKAVTWSLDCGSKIAKISDGKVTAGKIKEIEVITVTATSKENPDIFATHEITILPQVTKVSIEAPTKVIDIADGEGSLQLEAICTPEDASQNVTWSSSNKKIATVDEDGLVTAYKAGTVVIIAKAADGSGKSAKISLTVTKAVQDIEIVGPSEVAPGKKITLKANVIPANATNKKVTWSLDCSSSVATIKNGALTAKKVKEPVEVTVTVKSVENPDIYAEHVVTIAVPATSIEITAPRNTIDFAAEDKTLQLDLDVKPTGSVCPVTWISSKPEVATVDEDGLVSALAVGKTTITAIGINNSSLKSSFDVEVFIPLERIEIECPDEMDCNAAIMPVVKVYPENATYAETEMYVDAAHKDAAYFDEEGQLWANSCEKDTLITIYARSKVYPEIIASKEILIKTSKQDDSGELGAEDVYYLRDREFFYDDELDSFVYLFSFWDENKENSICCPIYVNTVFMNVDDVIVYEEIHSITTDDYFYEDGVWYTGVVVPRSDMTYGLKKDGTVSFEVYDDDKLYFYFDTIAFDVNRLPSTEDTNENTVEYITNWRFKYLGKEADAFVLSFTLKNIYETKSFAIPAYVPVRIVNDDGIEVYKKTHYITERDYGIDFSNAENYGHHQAQIIIDSSEIKTSYSKSGTVYFDVYLQDEFYFADLERKVYDLPVYNGIYTGDLLRFLGMDIDTVNELLADPMIKSTDGSFYFNDYFGMWMDSDNEVYKILLNASQYSNYNLFGVTCAMRYTDAEAYLKSYGWQMTSSYENIDGYNAIYCSRQYPNLAIWMKLNNNFEVEAVSISPYN